jgi:hypothetical protein
MFSIFISTGAEVVRLRRVVALAHRDVEPERVHEALDLRLHGVPLRYGQIELFGRMRPAVR